ncbi:uncharacterized protein [Triticum aestivum]|uniref:uncharacterized protein n=1 Tax=Triticum aestivum TaxID=4565 RepID=UPI001D007549|nr:uncharacterized protein LOC123185405 [Triticum aestivum]
MVHNLLATEERDDAHYSFLQVKKGYVLITRIGSITSYKNQYGQHRSGTQEQLGTHVAANDMCALDEWPTRVEGQRAVCLYVRGAWGLVESESVGCFGSKCCWDIFFLLWPIYIGIGRVKIPGWAAAHPGHPVAPPLMAIPCSPQQCTTIE